MVSNLFLFQIHLFIFQNSCEILSIIFTLFKSSKFRKMSFEMERILNVFLNNIFIVITLNFFLENGIFKNVRKFGKN